MSAVESLGKYEIRRQLGRGAMGTVYEGFDPIIERIVAIKTVHLPETADDEAAEEIARFRREAQAAGRLHHPNIVAVFDYGETAELAYIVMEYVDGPPLKTLLDKNERFPLPTIMRIMEDLLTGLQYSHERGVVHRDIKPANLMLAATGQAKIADFGIARIESSSMTQAGTVLGTPAYMSPEQFMGQVVDARTDIYSSGVLLYQLLTGERPFEGSMSAIMHKALNTEAPSPSDISVTAPRPFDTVVRKAMAKRPEDRYASAAEFLEAIRAAIATPAGEREDSGDATMVSVPRTPATLTAQSASGIGAARATSEMGVTPPISGMGAALPVTASSTAAAAPSPLHPSRATRRSAPPIVIGGGVAGLALLGGLGYYLLAGNPSSEPVKPASVTVAPPPAQMPPATGLSAAGPMAPASAPMASAPATSGSPLSARPDVVTAPPSPPPGAGPPSTLPGVVTAAPQTPPTLPPSSPMPRIPPAIMQSAPVLQSPTTLPQVALAPTAPSAEPVTPPLQQPAQGPMVSESPGNLPGGPSTDPANGTRAEIAGFVSRLPCSLLDGDVRDGAVQVSGIGGKPAIDNLRQKLTAMGLTSPVPSLRITQVDQSFCPWEDFIRPLGKTFGDGGPRLSLRLAGDPAWLVKDDYIRPRLAMPDFRGEMRVDYLDRQGNVQHLYPQLGDAGEHLAADPPHVFAPGETLSLGEPGPANRGWQVDEPFGTDVIIAVASEDALFDRPRTSNVEKAAVYLRDLKRAVELARSHGVRITAAALAVETRRK